MRNLTECNGAFRLFLLKPFLVWKSLSLDTGKFLLEGADNPGIVHTMTSALAQHGLSIDKMHTDCEIAPQGGTVLFRMNGTVSAAAPLASGFDAEKIRADMEAIGDSLNCDVSLEDA